MKIIAIILLVVLVLLQYRLWLGDGGIPEVLQLQDEVEVVQQDVVSLKERNQALDAEVQDLKTGLDAIEERARSELGMIRQGEVYYQVIEPRSDSRDDTGNKPKNKPGLISGDKHSADSITNTMAADKHASQLSP